MRIVVQRVTRSSVTIKGELISEIGKGLMVLIGVQEGDTEKDAAACSGEDCRPAHL